MAAYVRCRHCRGFYETALSACKYCGKKVTFNNAAGEAIVFPDRETCRAIQVAEYERLPAEAHADCMQPPPDELSILCVCLHCGPDKPPFEAVEMRWHAVEKMWACPCTTCGGRGFSFDIHPLKPRWECVECGHKWAPPGGNAKASNCKCPKCGCRNASGWFDDEYSEEEIEAMTEEEYKAAFGKTRAEEQAEYEQWNKQWNKDHPPSDTATDPVPWDNPAPPAAAHDSDPDDDADDDDSAAETDDEDADLLPRPEIPGRNYVNGNAENIPDDIDHPRPPPPDPNPAGEGPLNPDDIPY